MRIRLALVLAALLTLGVTTVAAAVPETFPGKGNGVGGTPGKNGTPGTFPGKGNGVSNTSTGTVAASEPVTLLLTGLGLLGASLLRRRR